MRCRYEVSIKSDEWCPVAAMRPCGQGPENASDVGYIRRIDAVASAQLIRGLWQLLRSQGGFTSAKADDSSSLGDRCCRGERYAGASGPGGVAGALDMVGSGADLRTHPSVYRRAHAARGEGRVSVVWEMGQGRPRRGAWRERRMSVAVPRAASHLAAQGRGAAAGWFRAPRCTVTRASSRAPAGCLRPVRPEVHPAALAFSPSMPSGSLRSRKSPGGRRGWLPRLCERRRASPLRASACGGCLRWPSGRCSGRLPGRRDAQGPPTGATGRR